MSSKFTKPNRPLTWLITGCSSGFGSKLSQVVQSNGHKLIATSRNPSRTPKLVADVEKKGGKWIKLDVDDPDCGKIVEDLEASGESIDILVNCAGWAVNTAVEHLTDDELRGMMETHYFGPFRLIRAALPHMRQRRYGVIINISSGAGLEARDGLGGYGAAKAAMDAASKTLAKEVAEFNVRVFIVSLGSFDTNMPNSVISAKNPLADDYKGKMVEKVLEAFRTGQFKPEGDPEKACKAIFELAVGEGIGAGREAERLLPLGTDLMKRIEEVQEYYSHAVEVFGDVARSVSKTS